MGKYKAESISKELNHLLDHKEPVLQHLSVNVLNNEQSTIEKLSSVDAIIDISTSIAVERKLSLDLPEETIRRISSFLNPTGTDLVLLVEDSKRKTRLDLLEMEYYRHLINNTGLNNHLSIQQEGRIRYASNSCRDFTSRINQENVSLHAAIAAKAIRLSLKKENGLIKIWNYNQKTLNVKSFEFKPSEWIQTEVDEWSFMFDKLVYKKMSDFREEKLPKETGGVLIGAYDFERKIVYIVDTLPAPKDSVEKNTTFIRGIIGLSEKVDQIDKITNDGLNYIGEWHSHPRNSSTNPSTLDLIFFESLKKELYPRGYPTLMIIVGDNEFKAIITES